jgi:hypothetical protein
LCHRRDRQQVTRGALEPPVGRESDAERDDHERRERERSFDSREAARHCCEDP